MMLSPRTAGRWLLAAVVFLGILSARSAPAVEVLGTGAGALLGSDLTDIDNDGAEDLYFPPDDFGGFDATFFSSDESAFGAGEAAFNVFDNFVGGGDDKWCCGTTFPQIVGADFTEAQGETYKLTGFTVTSANDTPGRDPVVWKIEGSNDGLCWETIFSIADLEDAVANLGLAAGSAIWTERLQVILFEEGSDYPLQEVGYSMFRMVTLETALTTGAFFQLAEIEFFGEIEDPGEPPDDCPTCFEAVTSPTCSIEDVGGETSLVVTWEAPAGCEDCADPTMILVDGVEAGTVPGDATSATIAVDELVLASIFTVEVRNCSGATQACSPFLTDAAGYLNAQAWLALGPFATPVACDGDAALLLSNHIGPEETIACQYPADGDPVEGYIPGDPLFPDPGLASTSGYHVLAPVDGVGNPIWRQFQDSTPADSDLDFDTDIVGAVDEHVMFIATWIENLSDDPIELQVCLGYDDDAQLWLDDQLVHNGLGCRARALCQNTEIITLDPGIHVLKFGIWEQGGGWGGSVGLFDTVTAEPVVDLAGVLDAGTLFGVSILSEDIRFHGPEKPAEFVDPDCDDEPICLGPTDLVCFRNEDGSVDLSWVNSEGCDEDIEILAGGDVVVVLDPDTEFHTFEAGELPPTTMLTLSNGGLSTASCSLVEIAPGLLGGDLTDQDDDGVEASYLPPDLGGFDAEFFSSDEPNFEGLEGAFNVFDNIVDAGLAKWCCGTVFPQIVGADFRETYGDAFRLTHFTVASANDTPARDPRVWRIEGSNDDVTWTPIFTQDNPDAALWTERLQVLVFREGREYPVQTEAYSMFRMVTEQTGSTDVAFFQIGEIEFFGEEGSGVREICDNGVDDDGDELTDCDDPECETAPNCVAGFERGDADSSGAINITDGIYILNFLFLGGPEPGCKDAADADDSGALNITDGIYVLNFLFLGGPDPLAPFGTCGQDPTADDVDCLVPHTQGNCAP